MWHSACPSVALSGTFPILGSFRRVLVPLGAFPFLTLWRQSYHLLAFSGSLQQFLALSRTSLSEGRKMGGVFLPFVPLCGCLAKTSVSSLWQRLSEEKPVGATFGALWRCVALSGSSPASLAAFSSILWLFSVLSWTSFGKNLRKSCYQKPEEKLADSVLTLSGDVWQVFWQTLLSGSFWRFCKNLRGKKLT